jgi:glycopeptide antibiotics resistance protein
MGEPLILEFVPFPLLIGIGVLIVFLIILARKKYSWFYLFCFSVFWFYLLIVVSVMIFPIPLPEAINSLITKQRVAFTLSHVNFVPFRYLSYFNSYVIVLEIARNILLTIPFAFGINWIAKVKPKNMIWVATAVGFMIEAAQLIVSLGIAGTYRTVDITDVLLNATGVLLGYCFFRVFASLYLTMTKRSGTRFETLTSYLYDISARG